MRFATPVVGMLLSAMAGCSRCSTEGSSQVDASAPVVPAAPTLRGTVTVKDPVDRAKAERIALFFARMRWSQYAPSIATGFNTGNGEYRVVVGFDRRPDAATVFVRISDGQVTDASIAPGDY
jgi:hypothetical protein